MSDGFGETGGIITREDLSELKSPLEAMVKFLHEYQRKVGQTFFESEVSAQCLQAFANLNDPKLVFSTGKFAITCVLGIELDDRTDQELTGASLLRNTKRALKMLEEKVLQAA